MASFSSPAQAGTLGVGLGLRSPHYGHILENRPRISWFEAISENYMGLTDRFGGRSIMTLESVRASYPIVLHGVSLSIGSADPLDQAYLDRLAELIQRIEPEWVSDHLCWTGVSGENLHDLLPLPYTEEALSHLSARIQAVQDRLKRAFTIENVSAYVGFRHSEMTEWEFLSELTRRTGCRLLIDVNNVFVSAHNFGFDPLTFLRGIPASSVQQMHLAGHSEAGGLLIDTHDHPVRDEVWDLYREATRLWGKIPTLIEWDDQIPEFEILEREARKAEAIQNSEEVRHERATEFA